MLDALGIDKAHIHGTSMGGMVAIIVAGKYPDRVQSVVINCAAAKLGFSGQLVFKNWIDLIKLEGCGSRILAELIAWQCLSRAYMETPEGQAGVDTIQQILRDANEDRVMIDACQAMIDMDTARVGAEDHLAGAGHGRRRGRDDAVGPGTRRRRPAVDRRQPAERRDVRRQRLATTPRSSTATEEHCRVVWRVLPARHPGAGLSGTRVRVRRWPAAPRRADAGATLPLSRISLKNAVMTSDGLLGGLEQVGVADRRELVRRAQSGTRSAIWRTL